MTDNHPGERVIVTKRRIYRLAPVEQGQPIEEALNLPANLCLFLKGAKVYQTADGPVIARPERPEEIRNHTAQHGRSRR
jgi:hypothetical protein